MLNLNDLMQERLREMYDGEKQFAKSLNKIHEKTSSVSLQKHIKEYELICEDQIIRLKQVFNLIFAQKRGEHSLAMQTLIEEAQKIIERCMEPAVIDAAIISALQRIIHFKIASYGAISNYSNTLGLFEEAGILHTNLEMEKRTDKKLAELAEYMVNMEAV